MSRPSEPAAHTPREGSDEWHSLAEHLVCVAHYAKVNAEKFDAGIFGYWAGLLHDIGKFGEEFQKYLWQAHLAVRGKGAPPKRGSVQHAIHGAIVARSAYHAQFPKLGTTAQGSELAWPILNHHGGLQELNDVETRLVAGMNAPEVRSVVADAAGQFPDLKRLMLEIPQLPPFESQHSREFFIRMLLSVLVDADHTDTEAWMSPEKYAQRRIDFSNLSELGDTLRENHQAFMQSAESTPVNVARREIYEAVVNNAAAPTGFFKLTVPTGGGKTKAALGFALEHAKAHNLERVVVAIPYTTITQQTADSYRDVLGSDNVLEHHSAINVEDIEGDVLNWQRLATENWNVPVVVTTTVQLFESLFANKTSRVRKLHNLARAVIVLDEVQTLPVKFLNPILDVLSELTSPRYGSSVVLCTATQPALNEGLGFPRLANIIELAPNPEHYFQTLTRVEYEIQIDTPLSWQGVAEEMRSAEQVLCIVNLKQHARELFEALDDPEALHLSTAMTPEHRRQVLASIKLRLKQRQPCRVVSTQLVEAGVDLDFPFVMRALGPLDSIVQAAGRCNREGKLTGNDGTALGRVLVFKPEDHRTPPGFYATASREAEILLKKNANLNSASIFEDYFRTLYMELAERDAEGIQALRKGFDYPTVADRFRMIGDDMEPAVVRKRSPEHVDALLAQGINRFTMRQLQPYTVNVFNGQTKRLQQQGFLMRPTPESEGIWIWTGDYDPKFGVVERYDADRSVF
ncbi:MAG: CRISPR-associated helicase Cas3' [Trueperaceae bacterium]